ncbi:hypothetical protein [Microcoleus sp. herbarium12]|uniref:hypothetical protein n=1 Tax=Microcoleus sp. herbarium12 TaxID=3055437 RepID=UPI002FD0824D
MSSIQFERSLKDCKDLARFYRVGDRGSKASEIHLASYGGAGNAINVWAVGHFYRMVQLILVARSALSRG